MSHGNKQTNDIYNLSGVEDLSCDTAANIQGGAAMELYRHANLKGDRLAAFNGGGVRTMSSNANNQASSVRIREGKWAFYDLPFWNGWGRGVTLGPGTWNFIGLNDKISSLKRVG